MGDFLVELLKGLGGFLLLWLSHLVRVLVLVASLFLICLTYPLWIVPLVVGLIALIAALNGAPDIVVKGIIGVGVICELFIIPPYVRFIIGVWK